MHAKRPEFSVNPTAFGGGYMGSSHAKHARPMAERGALHLVLRSSRARGSKSMLKAHHATPIWRAMHRLAERFEIRIYKYANAHNHLHLLVKISSRRNYNAFVRALSGLIARIVLQAERGRAKGEKFWDARPFTRIVSWGRDFRGVVRYIERNELEAIGFLPYFPRGYAQREASG